MKKASKMQKGFTLVETLIYTVLVGVVITGFIAFALLISGLKSKNYVIGEVNANTRLALNLISQKIKQAEDVASPTAGNASSTLILQMSGGSSTTTISEQGGVLKLQAGEAPPLSITSNEIIVSDLTFNNLTSSGVKDNISVFLKIGYNNAGSLEFNYEQDLETAVSLRQ